MVDYTKRPSSSGATPPPAGGAGAGAGGVSLSKVTLTKAAPSISLTKGGGASGQMRVRLTWNAKPDAGKSGGGFLKKLAAAGSKGIDLDLGALFELADGRKGVIQALGNQFGSLQQPPYVQLSGDDRTGGGGEELVVNLDQLPQIRRILVFAFIYEGVPAWDKADGVVTLYPQGAAPIEVKLDESSGSRMCAIALLEVAGNELKVRREVQYIQGAQDALDRAYGWGMDWTPGRK